MISTMTRNVIGAPSRNPPACIGRRKLAARIIADEQVSPRRRLANIEIEVREGTPNLAQVSGIGARRQAPVATYSTTSSTSSMVISTGLSPRIRRPSARPPV